MKEYYEAVCAALSERGFSKLPDKDTVEDDFNAGLSVDDCIEGFLDDWGDPGDEEID